MHMTRESIKREREIRMMMRYPHIDHHTYNHDKIVVMVRSLVLFCDVGGLNSHSTSAHRRWSYRRKAIGYRSRGEQGQQCTRKSHDGCLQPTCRKVPEWSLERSDLCRWICRRKGEESTHETTKHLPRGCWWVGAPAKFNLARRLLRPSSLRCILCAYIYRCTILQYVYTYMYHELPRGWSLQHS